MNHISMFSSSDNLRSALHRVLAVSQIIGTEIESDAVATQSGTRQDTPWWQTFSTLSADEQAAVRTGQLSRRRIGELMCMDTVYAALCATWRRLDLAALPPPARLAEAFRDAEISSRAISQHGGRDVYGSSNKRLWDILVAPLGGALSAHWGDEVVGWYDGPTDAVRAEDHAAVSCLRDLLAFDTRPEGPGHRSCVGYLRQRFTQLGFDVEVEEGHGPPILVAHRPARGLQGAVVMYGHYDVAPLGRAQFTHPPMELTPVADDSRAPGAEHAPRLFGRGVADNKGPLAVRIAALGGLRETPALHVLLQGEEETGSRSAHAFFPQHMAALHPTVWLDETGYHDHVDGTLRLLARTIGPQPDQSCPPDAAMRELLMSLRLLASRHRVATREEWRSLNKSEVAGGCPFNHNLPMGARYLALGINDTRAQIHRADESIPTWTFQLHREELRQLFRWVDRTARAEA